MSAAGSGCNRVAVLPRSWRACQGISRHKSDIQCVLDRLRGRRVRRIHFRAAPLWSYHGYYFLVATCGASRAVRCALAAGLLYAIHRQVTARRVILSAVQLLTVDFFSCNAPFSINASGLMKAITARVYGRLLHALPLIIRSQAEGWSNFEMARATRVSIDTDAVRYSDAFCA